MKKITVWSSVLVLLLLIGGYMSTQYTRSSHGDRVYQPSSEGYIHGVVSSFPLRIIMELSTMLGREKDKFKALEKIDFSNTGGKNNFYILSEKSSGKTNYKSILGNDELSVPDISSVDRHIITLKNRIEGVETDLPELMAFLPNVTEEACRIVMKSRNNNENETVKIPEISVKPDLTLHQGLKTPVRIENITTLPGLLLREESNVKPVNGCVRHQGVNYYYQIMLAF